MLDCIVDVSHWQPPERCDWAVATGAGIRGVIVKATQGMQGVDHACAEHIKRARDAGLLLGCYHFLTGENGADQADHFMEVTYPLFGLGRDDPYTGFVLAMDWERNTGPGGQASPQQAYDFLYELRDWGGRQVLYGNPTKALGYRDLHPSILDMELWLPKYGNPPDDSSAPGWPLSRIKLWQHTDGRQGYHAVSVPGLGQVDRSIWFGDEAGLRGWWTTDSGGEK